MENKFEICKARPIGELKRDMALSWKYTFPWSIDSDANQMSQDEFVKWFWDNFHNIQKEDETV